MKLETWNLYCDFQVFVHTCILPGYITIHSRHSIPKHNDSHYGGRYQQLSVNTEPCEIQADLLPKVLSVG